MLIREKIGIMAVLTVLVCFLGACAGSKLQVAPITTLEDPIEQVNNLDKDIAKARKNRLNVLSPTWFGKAETSLFEAKKGLKSGDKPSEILQKVNYGRAQLQRAEDMGKRVRTALIDVIKARERARVAGATNFRKDYSEADEKFLELTKAIEKNNLRWALKNRAKVIRDFDELELRAIKDVLVEVGKLINEAKKRGARKIAPKMFTVAQEKLSDVDAFISEHRYERRKIDEQASEALFQARRLLQVMRQSEKIRTMKPEEITLWFEGMLHKMTNKLYVTDIRDEDFETQVKNILGFVTRLQEDYQFLVGKEKVLQAEIQDLEKRIASLERTVRKERAAKDSFAAEMRFNEFYSNVRSYFKPSEAEVYKQGNQLVIRLRSMQFPVGKEVIMPSNYALLSKIQRAIRTFGQPDVIIEGHTDSTGSDDLNEYLSQQRAEAVREYLVANGTITYERISAIGYGSKQPLTSNKTAEGRAINRRIDVLIMPRLETGQ
jgi:outer membrane protein OmpA-like peptidoglycan-associated protein